MGYDSRVRGIIAIDPPLTWAEIDGSPFLPDKAWMQDLAVKLHVTEEPVTTADGVLLRRSSAAFVPVTDDEYRAYTVVEDVQKLVSSHGEGRTFTGRLSGFGSDPGDLWRVEIREGRAVRVEPRIVWPDGSEGV